MLPLFKPRKNLFLTLLVCLSLLLFPLISHAIDISEIPNPRVTNGTWVSDTANIISDRTEEQINRQIDLLDATNGTEIAVVTVTETKPAASPKEFTTQLFNTWKIGKAGQNNGMLVLVSVADKRVEIETGIGIEAILPNAEISRIIQNDIIPFFKQQDFDGGILAGVKTLVNIAIQDDFTSAIPTQVKSASPIYPPYRLNRSLFIFGCFASVYYYFMYQAKLKPVYLKRGGYSRNKYLKESLKKRQIYILVYFSCVSLSAFVIVPFLASVSSYLLLLYLASIQIFWLLELKSKTPSLSEFGLFVASPLLLCLISLLILYFFIYFIIYFYVVFLIVIGLYIKAQENRFNPHVPIFMLVSSALFVVAGFEISDYWNNSQQQPVILFGFASSIALASLVWQHLKLKPEFQSENNIYCQDCKYSLNRVDSGVLADYLKPQQQTAWRLRSVTYQGWQCANCSLTEDKASSIHICADVNVMDCLSDRILKCKTCQELTVTRKTEVVEPATTRKKGLRVHTYTCQCCESTYEKKETIPRKSSSSKKHHDSNYSSYSSYDSDSSYSSSDSSYSSGDSGGSSFGGGESDGGGAGGDW